jgi:hypothetical protein
MYHGPPTALSPAHLSFALFHAICGQEAYSSFHPFSYYVKLILIDKPFVGVKDWGVV